VHAARTRRRPCSGAGDAPCQGGSGGERGVRVRVLEARPLGGAGGETRGSLCLVGMGAPKWGVGGGGPRSRGRSQAVDGPGVAEQNGVGTLPFPLAACSLRLSSRFTPRGRRGPWAVGEGESASGRGGQTMGVVKLKSSCGGVLVKQASTLNFRADPHVTLALSFHLSRPPGKSAWSGCAVVCLNLFMFGSPRAAAVGGLWDSWGRAKPLLVLEAHTAAGRCLTCSCALAVA